MKVPKKLTILQINDSHGYLRPHDELYFEDGKEIYKTAGGYARIASLFKKIKNENPNGTIILDNGDTIHGTFLAIKTRGRGMVPILNKLELDAMTAHWEFAYGPNEVKEIEKSLDFPILAINCYYDDTDELFFKPYLILERLEYKIGIIGIACNIIDKTMPPAFSEGVHFTLGNKELSKYISELKQKGIDLIIVLSHLGYPQELQLAKETDGIDILLSGHTHNRVYSPVIENNAIVIQSGCHGSFVGKLILSLKNGEIDSYKHQLINIDNKIKKDSKIDTLIEELYSPFQKMLETVIGETKAGLHRYHVMESKMDNLLLEAIINTSGSKIAFSNGWRYGAPIPPRKIILNDVWNIVPTNPPISVCDISGEDLWNMMEENLENTFSRNPYNQMGGYVKRCKGINIYFKVENPNGKRIQEFFIGNDRLNLKKNYKASYLTEQGIPKKYGFNHHNLDIRAVDALHNYIKQNSPIKIEKQNSIVPI
ncbi:MAG: bifunctional metallophosphatase/5'-nucleotidase [Promethearchaeota archaeon]|nr:MAG: bifunctional metallophosphatase/5'-nucleotidase [Candidatus Lokiarchaeota archaeon]